MTERRQTILSLLAAAALLFAVSAYRQLSIHHLPSDIFRPYIVYAVYMLLLFSWQHSIRTKILQKSMRIHLTAQNIICFFYLTVRFVQDAFLYSNIPLMRFTGYFINIPSVLVPLLGLYAAFYLGKGESYRINFKWYLLLIPAAALIIMALTDEWHHLLCYVIPQEPQPNLYFHPYIGSYLIHAWAFIMFACQIYIIQTRSDTSRHQTLYQRFIPLYQPILMLLFGIPYFLTSYTVRYELVEFSAGMIFIVILCWELYILLGLIPVNTGYDEVFRRSTIAMQIFDPDGKRLAAAENALPLKKSQLSSLAENGSLYLGDTVLHMHKTAAEAVVWQNDLSQIHKAIRELRETNAVLKQGRDLMEKEIQVRSEESRIQARNHIYDSLTEQVSDQLLLLLELLKRNPETAKDWERIRLIGTYIKRFCNLQLIRQESGLIPNQDLQISLNDLLDCMERIGILTGLDFHPDRALEPELILTVIKVLEHLLEHSDFSLKSVNIQIGETILYDASGAKGCFSGFTFNSNYRIETEINGEAFRLKLYPAQERR